jgi:hypothetical protein
VTVVATPFTRFARVHTLSTFADGLVTIALAGSIFFSVDPSAAREKVALYLFLTIAPFAVVTPLIGPAVDRARGGRRSMVLLATFGRAGVAFLMAGHIDSLLLFPEAFAMLVLQKTYVIANRALVPKLVASERQLVEANSKLALLSSVGSMSGAATGAVLAFIGGPGWAAGAAFIGFVVSGIAALQLPMLAVADQPPGAEERRELRGSSIVLAGTAMGVMRGVVGFLTFLLAFELRGGKEGVDIGPEGAAAGAATAIVRRIDIIGDPRAPTWHFGLVVAGAGVGALVGARLAPALRRRVPEEHIVVGALIAAAAVGGFAAWNGTIFGAFVLSLAVAFANGAGKLAFDSLVQRDAPDANYGRSFARFEARFQLTWVIGAFVPVVLPLSSRLGFTLLALAAAAAAASYVIGVRSARHAPQAAPPGHLVTDDENWVVDTDWSSPLVPGVAPAVDPTRVFTTPTDLTHTAPSPGVEPSPPEPAHPGAGAAVPAPAAPAAPTWGSTSSEPVISAGEGVHVEPVRRRPPEPPR